MKILEWIGIYSKPVVEPFIEAIAEQIRVGDVDLAESRHGTEGLKFDFVGLKIVIDWIPDIGERTYDSCSITIDGRSSFLEDHERKYLFDAALKRQAVDSRKMLAAMRKTRRNAIISKWEASLKNDG